MTGLIALVGGHEHQPGSEPIHRRLMAEVGVARPIVVVLLAATTPGCRAFKIKEAQRCWSRFGARVEFGFLGGADEAERALLLLTDPDLVVLTGGRPWRLDARLMGPVLDRVLALWRAGMPLAASSAGAMALCAWRLSIQRHRLPRVVAGFGLVPAVGMAPHFDRFGITYWSRLVARRHPELQVIGLSDCTALVGRDRIYQVLGAGRCVVLRHNARNEYTAGEQLWLDGMGVPTLASDQLPAHVPALSGSDMGLSEIGLDLA